MTEDEQRNIIGQVVMDLAAARKRLACLEIKAEKTALHFGLICNWLNGHFPTGVELPDGLSVEDALALVTEIKATKAEIERLERRRAELGIGQ